MKEKTYVVIMLIVMWAYTAQGQTTRVLRKGDVVPDHLIGRVLNFPNSSVKISDFKDKILILDFWIISCTPCIKAFPKIDSLQRKFPNEIQFLPVTWDNPEKVITFFNRINKNKKFIIPIGLDSTLHKYFLDDAVWSGQYIWIKNGVIIGLTKGYEGLTEVEIRSAIKSNNIGKRTGIDKLLPAVFDKPLLGVSVGTSAAILQSSTFTTYLPGYESQPYIKYPEKNDSISGLRFINLPLYFFYAYAYNMHESHEIAFEMNNPDHFNPIFEDQDSSNLYCYELLKSKSEPEDLRRVMKADLAKTFGYNISEEVRERDCLVLKISDASKLTTLGGKPEWKTSSFYITMKNQPFRYLSNWLKNYLASKKTPFLIDDTGFTGNIDLSIDAKMSDPGEVAAALKKYGLDLVVEKRKMKMKVIQ